MSNSRISALQELPTDVNLEKLQNLQADFAARESLLRQIAQQFEQKHRCSLESFERKLENLELPEHPHWEESIEWRNAIEQIQRIQDIRSILAWLTNLLAQSRSS